MIEDDGADDKFPDVPLSRQYERKFEHRYVGAVPFKMVRTLEDYKFVSSEDRIMARLRQQHPQNYVNSGNIHTDFENLFRYINSQNLKQNNR